MDILKSVGNGIMGFEYVKEWDILEDGPDLMIIEAVNDRNVRFYLINSLHACEHYETSFANAQENNWYVLLVKGLGTNSMNTKSPIVISNGSIEQVLMATGEVNTPCGI